jgi:hypothetical protein
VLEESGIGIDVRELRGVGWAGCVGTVLRVGAVGVLGPETVKDEGGAAGALSGVGMPVAELGRPGEVEQVVIERLRIAGRKRECCRRVWSRRGLRCGSWGRGTRGEDEKKDEDGGCRSLLHGGSKNSRRWRNGHGEWITFTVSSLEDFVSELSTIGE